jgi:poly-gamma-glutamate synthesis protein (capsule biosynthesis protein)
MVKAKLYPPARRKLLLVDFVPLYWLAGLLILSLGPMNFPIHLAQANPLETEVEIKPFYQRADGILAEAEETVELIIVGDIMLGRGVSGVSKPLSQVARRLAAADLVAGNFEGVLEDARQGEEYGVRLDQDGPIVLRMAPESVQELQSAGIDLVSLANNHSLDLGEYGLYRTAMLLQKAGIQTVGAGQGLEAAYQPVIFNVKRSRVAFFAVNAVSIPDVKDILSDEQDWQKAAWDEGRLENAIRRICDEVDAVIVLAHWGDEYALRSGPAQQRAARRLIEAGADAVIGSHPHVVQETEVFERQSLKSGVGFIAYSLGNFVFDQFEGATHEGMALSLVFDSLGLREARPLPAAAGPKPRWLLQDEAGALLKRTRPQPAHLAYQCSADSCRLASATDGVGSGLFYIGQIDLTGDGVLETVRRVADHVLIYEQGKLVWESPVDWQVLDAALGDPNDDGRAEIVLALLKPDPQGILRSHPFLIGYRGGIYRQVWGGSAVSYPILEIELADLDGDRSQELVVLEERDPDRQAITVWRWHDWVFCQEWSSPESRLENLVAVDGDRKNPIVTIERLW